MFHKHERRKSFVHLTMFFSCSISDFKSQRGGGYGYSVPIILLYSYLYHTILSTSALLSDKTHINCVVLHDVADNHRQ
jgi:hypothetical protein